MSFQLLSGLHIAARNIYGYASQFFSQDLLYTNWPKTPEAYAAAVVDNAAQRGGVWYPDEQGRPGMFAGQGTWAKAFSATWDFLWGDSSENDVVHR